eukprot:COSAG01_NODE_36723_length_513_cov_1.154589_1_plen_65_part_00
MRRAQEMFLVEVPACSPREPGQQQQQQQEVEEEVVRDWQAEADAFDISAGMCAMRRRGSRACAK